MDPTRIIGHAKPPSYGPSGSQRGLINCRWGLCTLSASTKAASTPPKTSINAPAAAVAFQGPHPLAGPSVPETQKEAADPLAIYEDLRPGNQGEHAKDLWLYLKGDVEVLSDSDPIPPSGNLLRERAHLYDRVDSKGNSASSLVRRQRRLDQAQRAHSHIAHRSIIVLGRPSVFFFRQLCITCGTSWTHHRTVPMVPRTLADVGMLVCGAMAGEGLGRRAGGYKE